MLLSRQVARVMVLGVLAGCGGATSEGASTSSGGAAPGGGGDRACTEIGCANAFELQFAYRERGAYLFELDVDGASVVCKATIPLAKDGARACSSEAAQLGLVGSMLPESQQSIGGLTFFTLPRTVKLRASRDGAPLVDTTLTPTYRVTPGPNGPGCEPKECRSATATLP